MMSLIEIFLPKLESFKRLERLDFWLESLISLIFYNEKRRLLTFQYQNNSI